MAEDENISSKGNPAVAAGLIVAAFLALVAVHVLWKRAEDKQLPGGAADRVASAPVRIEGEKGEVQIGARSSAYTEERERLRTAELKRQIELLLTGDKKEDRRSAALRLVFIADRSATQALLKGLKDTDRRVASRCARALLNVWQQSESAAAFGLFRQGRWAYEEGNLEEAVAIFNEAAKLDARVPELYRLRGEIHLSNSNVGQALADGRRALKLEPSHFLGHCLVARCHLAQRNGKAALASVERALGIYPTFEDALQLRRQARALRKAEGK